MTAQHGGTAAGIVHTALSRYGVDSGRTALVHDGRTVSYPELKVAVQRACALLRAHGARPGDHVALLLRNSPEYVVWQLAALCSGTPMAALNPMSSRPDQEFVLADAEATLLVNGDDQAEAAAAMGYPTVPASSCWDDAVDYGPLPDDVSEPADIACLSYTGGTTGRPKGVVQTHEMLRQVVLMELAEWPWPRPPRFVAATPLSHGAGFFVLPTLLLGGLVITTSGGGAVNLADVVRTTGATVTFLVPSLMHSILAQVDDPKTAFASLALTVYGASPIAPGDLVRCVDVFGPNLVQLYGQTESPMILTTLRPEDHDVADPARLRSCGLPSIGATVVLLDEDDRPVATGDVGEICARGPLVMPGYWHRPEETAAALRSGWLHTGDLGVTDADGYLTIVGRKKDMIITGGFNVYPKEVEAALLEHPAVADASVFGVSDAAWGERVVAAVVVTGDVDLDEVKAFVRERKGPVQTPKDIVVVPDIPLTAVGKPDKPALRRQVTAELEGAQR
ncbi:MAG TPA: AMP-binding protein [Pseudonocardiaceae bacterium]|nr:AMP-binding protein [Pseudonocardiaceae bacterium]